MLNKIKDRLTSFSFPLGISLKQILTATGSIALAGAIILSLWNQSNGYVALYGVQEQLPTSQIVEALGAENITYRIDPNNGQVLVKENKLAQARMALAAKGISAILPDGYELMDKDELLGSSQFIQNVRYKRSLEGELSKSIMSLDSVENARVHLGLSESSSFVMTNKPNSSASVVVKLRYGKRLNDEQVAAVVQLVAGSVPGMAPANVRVVDQEGNLLSDTLQGEDSNLISKRLGSTVVERIKSEIHHNIAGLLTSLVGPENFRISVAPAVNLSSIEETQERLGKEPQISEEQLNRENTTHELALGIPGSLSNRPVNQTPPAANNQGAQANATPNPQASSTNEPVSLMSRNQEQRKYAFDRDIRHIRHPGFKLEKLSIAVALNQQSPALEKITPEQLASITKLLESAAGIDKTRGDTLILDVLTFTALPQDIIPDMKWWQDPAVLQWSKLGGMGLLALLAFLFIIRPLMKRLTQSGQLAAATPENTAPTGEDTPQTPAAEKTDSLEKNLNQGALNHEDNLPPLSSGLETKVRYLQVLAHNEAERVAEVLKQWINSNDRSNNV
ncbi:flagellar MS-ring protein [Chania multitudinisentens RB-25]|uniref:Flagellar M-ring protein n=1 Tax=Chania multitudinisentens RB-25 TaxID=1441930 RepID=W0LB86_9GAMM|nr:flagellar basal-body MS-ring/collar protein FliF [Chania multitudinisentens]AHG19659.1 flagellar MS-ring protein [Chania multitudinisentens RB-25]